MQGKSLLRSTLAIAVLLMAFACGATSASAGTGGTTAPSGGDSQSGGTSPKGPSSSTQTGGQTTGGVSPRTVREPTAPVKQKPKKKKKKKRRRHPAQAPAPAPAPATVPAPGPTSTSDIPSDYLAAYKAAAVQNGIDWRVLAAIGNNESDHGRSTAPGVHSGVNYAKCCSGPMQMCTIKACSNTWGYYAVDGDGDGLESVYDPEDAIFAAAAMVRDLEALVGPDPKLLLAAYNAGPGNVKKYKGVPPFPETKKYVSAGLAYIAGLQ